MALLEPESKNLKGGGKGTAIGQQTRAILDCQVSLDSFGAELLVLIAIGIKIFPVLPSGQNCRLWPKGGHCAPGHRQRGQGSGLKEDQHQPRMSYGCLWASGESRTAPGGTAAWCHLPGVLDRTLVPLKGKMCRRRPKPMKTWVSSAPIFACKRGTFPGLTLPRAPGPTHSALDRRVTDST